MTLIEVLVAATVLGLLAVGVMSSLDVSARVSGDTKAKATAGTIAEGEMERIRGLTVTDINNLSGSPQSKSVGGVTYTVTSKAEWVANQAGQAFSCSVTGGTTYLKLAVTVKWPGSSTPVKLESILAPGARNVVRTVGALALRFKDQNNTGIPGVTVTISSYGQSNRTGTTDANGCIVWSTLPAGTWELSASKPNYLLPNGSTTATDEINVPGQTFVTNEYEMGLGGSISGSFITKRSGADVSSAPEEYTISHPQMSAPLKVTIPAGQSTFTTPTLYPYGSDYSIWAGGCTTPPPASGIATKTVNPGATVSAGQVRLPSLNVRTLDNGSLENGVTKVTVCGKTYTRSTSSSGVLSDPGFPYSTSASVCGQVTTKDPGSWFGESAYSNTVSGQAISNYTGTSLDFDAVWTRRCNGLPFFFGICFGIVTYTPPSGWGSGGC